MNPIKVATIEQVVSTLPILNNLDFIYLTNDRYSIVGRGDHLVGERVVFVYPGAKMPKKYGLVNDSLFVRAIKLHGYHSSGLVLSLPDELSEETIGEDVSLHMGIQVFRGSYGFTDY